MVEQRFDQRRHATGRIGEKAEVFIRVRSQLSLALVAQQLAEACDGT